MYTRRAGAIALAAGSACYALLVFAASARVGPRGWGLHAPGFLPLPLRLVLLAALAGCVAMLALSALRFGPRAETMAEASARPRTSSRRRPWLLALVLPYAAALWALRARTQLLGDGAVWLATARSGERRAYSEPLFAMLWHAFAEAIPFLREGIRRGPDRWEGRYNLGLCYTKLGRYDAAVGPLREAVALQGNLPVVRQSLGIALYRSGQTDSAVVVWREILVHWPGYAATLRQAKDRPAP